MFKPLSLFIALRYTKAKRRNHFISFIALNSMLGIALGVMVLITVLSVFNGFDFEIRNRIFGMANQVTITHEAGQITHWQVLSKKLLRHPHVIGAAPFVFGQGMLSNEGVIAGVGIFGILPKQQSQVSVLGQHMIAGKLSTLTDQPFGIVIGEQLADNLNLSVGDSVTLITPAATVTPAGILPRLKRFKVVGVFNVGHGFGYDSNVAFIHLPDAQVLFQAGEQVTGVRLKLDDLYLAPQIARELGNSLDNQYAVTDWTAEYGSFFQAIAMEKNMMFILLAFIIAIAAFNLVSSLVMVVTDKRADIAILRTLGVSPRTILNIFILQGFIIGVVGVGLGVLSGVWLSYHITGIVSSLQKILHTQLLSSDVYLVDFLASRLDWHDVWHVVVIAMGMCLLATLYPARQAAHVQPAEALRYE